MTVLCISNDKGKTEDIPGTYQNFFNNNARLLKADNTIWTRKSCHLLINTWARMRSKSDFNEGKSAFKNAA